MFNYVCCMFELDDGAPPVLQTDDGFLNFTSIRRNHSGWYKCTSRHLLSEYSSIGYFLNVRCKLCIIIIFLTLKSNYLNFVIY